MSRDARLHVADIVAGDAVRRYLAGVSFDAFAANDEQHAAVERQVFVIGEAAARPPDEGKRRRPTVPYQKTIGLRNLGSGLQGDGVRLPVKPMAEIHGMFDRAIP